MRVEETVTALRMNVVSNVLLCDDDREPTDVLARELEGLGHAVTIARTCAEAFAAACARDFDVLVATPFLRDGSTLVLPSALGIRRPRLTVLVSRLGDRLAPMVVRRVGFDAQLTKIVDARHLDHVVRSSLATVVTVETAEVENAEPAPASEVGSRTPR
jgi:DNA-binding response OmpR family regulator